MPKRPDGSGKAQDRSGGGEQNRDDVRRRIANLENDLACSHKRRDEMGRNYYSLLSTIKMPCISVDSDWRIVRHWGNFSTLNERVAELSAANAHLSELLQDGDFDKIKNYFERIAALKNLPFDSNDEPWVLEYEGPSAGESLGREWLVSRSCKKNNWHLAERDGRIVIEHRRHQENEADCYLMNCLPLNRPDRDIKVIFRIRTGHDPDGIRDLSLVLGGALGQDEKLCDSLGYTVCSGSVYNLQARIQRQAADLAEIKESLHADRNYEIVVERTGGRIRRFLTDLETGEQAPVLETVDSEAVYDRSPYIGFTTFSGEASFYGLKVFTRRSLFKIGRFRIPFEVDAGLKGLNGKRFKLRMGKELHHELRWIILFEDITEQRRVEEKIRFSEEKYRALFEMESDALFLISNVDGRILEVNSAAEEMYGYSRSELLLLRNVDLSGEPDQTRKATVGGLTSIPVRWHRKKDGTVIPVEINARHFTWQGLPVHLAAIRGIEERIRSQKELDEQRQFLRQVIDMNPSIIFVLDSEGRNILSNQALQNILGATQEELSGKFPDEFIPDPEHARRSRQMDLELIEGSRDRVESEEVIKDRQGKTHRVYSVKVPQRDESGKVIRIFGVSTDITAIRQGEEALRRSEKRFRELFEHSNDAVFIHDFDGRIVDVNRQACRMLGYTREGLLKLSVLSLHPEQDKAGGQRQLEILHTQGAATLESRLERADGSTLEVEINSKLIDLEAHTVQSVVRDITERKRAEETLRESERKYRALFDTSSEALAILDAETGRYIEVNQAGQALFGYSRQEFLERITPFDLNDDKEQMERVMREVGSSDKVHKVELVLTRKNGEKFPIEIYASNFSLGGHKYILTQGRDITERKRAEQALLESERKYRVLFDTSSEALAIIDTETGRFVEVNRAGQELFGYTRQEFLESITTFDLNPERGPVEKIILEAIASGKVCRYELIHIRKDGSRFPAEVFISAFTLEGRKYILAQARDITERKHAEQALRESERRYRALFDTSSEALAVVDMETRKIIDVNWAAEKLYGYSREEFIGLTPADASKDRKRVENNYKKLIKEGAIHGLEVIHYRKGGIPMQVEVFGSLFQLEGRNYAMIQVRDITERKRSEEALRESERKYRALFDTSSEALIIIDLLNRKFIDVNRSALTLYGYSREEFLNQSPLVISADPDLTLINFERLIKTGAIQHFEIFHTRKDGSKLPVEIYGSTFQLKGQTCAIIQVRDITERKKAEEALRESEARSRAMLETIPDLMFRLDANGIFLDCKGQTEDLIVPMEQMLGKSARVFLPGPVAEMTIENIRKVLKTGGVQKFEYEIPSPAGARYFETRMVGINDNEVLALERDITERKRAEQQLAQAHAELDQIFNATNPIAVIGADGIVLRVNRSWREIFGQTMDEVAGKKCCDIWHGRRCGTKDCPLETIRGGLDRLELEIEKKASDGRVIPCILTVTPLRGPSGELLGIVESFKDISELRQLEQERLRADKLESIGLLAGGIAHDFNNILTAIMGNASLAKMLVDPEDKIQEPLNAIESSSLRARELTMQLLTFSRGGQPVKQAASLADLVKEAARFALSGSNVTWEFHFQADLWPVEVDPGQINQVLNNLIINADQAMPGGGVIRINLENRDIRENEIPGLVLGRFVRLSISDSGIGISQEHLTRIFDPYFTTKQKGSGLGLATVYSIIRRHGGLITVDSEPQKGTTFRIWLPASLQEPKVTQEKAPLRSGSGERVLVMDDDPGVRKVLESMLKSLGYEVELAEDGEEAVKLYIERMARGRPFDAVVMDLTIPGGMGGREAVQKLLEIDPEVKAIVSSGYSNEQILSDFRKYGFSGIMAKPYRLDELRTVMDQVLSGS